MVQSEVDRVKIDIKLARRERLIQLVRDSHII